ncbi:hypothetical protein PIB30_015604 [Stylosanthes scabra]|uniref:Uncharacterized protein n=1 Tax=Stylosanthes scabra TaxID=79078 RepID=A0ABU6R7D1_9FABA|nr:hypothetical protein [Stylosanthes scabra]
MATEGRESTPISRDRAVGGESWSTTSSHRGASSKKKRFVVPICDCGTNAILFESSTAMNPNRLFLATHTLREKSPIVDTFIGWMSMLQLVTAMIAPKYLK